MAKVRRIHVEILTGSDGHTEPVMFEFNSHALAFRPIDGGTSAGQRFEGDFEPESIAHSVTLIGPATGKWSIESLRVTYTAAESPHSIEFGPFELDEDTAADIWEPPPLPSWEV